VDADWPMTELYRPNTLTNGQGFILLSEVELAATKIRTTIE
jgi:hypothetical protein